jgi:hypothetical protein
MRERRTKAEKDNAEAPRTLRSAEIGKQKRI